MTLGCGTRAVFLRMRGGGSKKTFSRPMTGRASFKDGDPELDLEATHHLVAGSPENPATT